MLERRSWMLLGLLCFVSLAGCSGKVITVDGATVLVSERATSGMDAALVLTGDSSRDDLAGTPQEDQPTHVLERLIDLLPN